MLKKRWVSLCSSLLVLVLLAACGGTKEAESPKKSSEPSSVSSSSPSPSPSPSASASASKENVVLKVYRATSTNYKVDELTSKFEAEYPYIKVEYEMAPQDQFEKIVNTRLVSGDGPDIFTTFMGKKGLPYIEAGYLLDLSNEPWVQRLNPKTKEIISVNGKIYSLPISQNFMGVIYNKAIFQKAQVEEPKTWDEFINVLKKLKDQGIAPFGIGLQDLFTTVFLPNAMAPSAIYRDNPDFNDQMYAGKQTFANSPWEKMLEDIKELNKYMMDDALGISNDQLFQVMASEQVAMTLHFGSAVGQIRKYNPNIELGMFAFPYVQGNEELWIPSLPVPLGGIYSKTKHPEEAKLYLDFMTRPENVNFILKQSNGFSVLTDVEVDIDPVLKPLEPYVKKGHINPYLDAFWPANMNPTLMTEMQKLLFGGKSSEMIKRLDQAFKEGNK